jgi:hypothetical protein
MTEFMEVAHCGGQFTVRVEEQNGRRSVAFGFQLSRPAPAKLFAIYCLPAGIPIATIALGGIGDAWDPPPFPDSIPVYIASDSQGYFGHECPSCKGYWRSNTAGASWPMTCAYCGYRGPTHWFRTKGQRAFIEHYCRLAEDAMHYNDPGEYLVDMDRVADQVAGKVERPRFYYAEETQQTNFVCSACGGKTDILGHSGYCSACGTWNGLDLFELQISSIRDRLVQGSLSASDVVKDAVSAFDSCARSYTKQLAARIPMTPGRRQRFERMLFHDLRACAADVKGAFDIDILGSIGDADLTFINRMFHRRHVYEHNGGEVDDRYLTQSGDTSVRLKQAIREMPDNAMRTTQLVVQMMRNLHRGFHSVFPPERTPVEYHQQHQKALSRHQ